ncbi:MAG: glycosyltransferase family 2 protein, partial [Alphaproteobacteria bacterium]
MTDPLATASTRGGVASEDGGAASDPPRLAVVIVNWNGAEYLPACVASVVRPGREVIVVDNGSTDGSRERLGGLAASVRWIENGANLGFSRAANRGLRAATARLVLFLNPDATANEPALAETERILDGDPGVGLVSVAVTDERGRVVPTVEPFLSLRTLAGGRSETRVTAPAGPAPVRVDWVHGAFLAGRREEVLALGGFDERLFLYAEDMNLCRRVQESGKAVVYSPRVSIFHRGNAAGETLLGSDRPAAILASQLLDHRARHGAASTLALRGAAAAFHGLRWALDSLRGDADADRHRSLARVALRGPSAGPLAEASRRAALAPARIAKSPAPPRSPPQ